MVSLEFMTKTPWPVLCLGCFSVVSEGDDLYVIAQNPDNYYIDSINLCLPCSRYAEYEFKPGEIANWRREDAH